MDLHMMCDTAFIIDQDEKRHYVIAFDEEYLTEDGDGPPGRFLAASVDTGKFSWVRLSECRYEFSSEDDADEECRRVEAKAEAQVAVFEKIMDKITSDPTWKAWMDALVVSAGTKTMPPTPPIHNQFFRS